LDSIYLLDQYVTTKPGQPFRLFPFGQLVKNGKVREITRELAEKFKLPHFQPAIKLGSHEDATPAGGFITSLEVREDGLYAIPEWNEKGEQANNDGAYRYQSPEVIWGGGGLEDPTTGKTIEGPLVVGVALLHTPHLGNAAALYSIERDEEVSNMGETVQVPMSFWEKFITRFESEPVKPEPKEPKVDSELVEKFEAAQKERDEFKAELDRMQAEADQAKQLDHFRAELKETKLADDEELVTLLSGLEKEKAEKIVQHFKALSEQIKESNLTAPTGDEGDGPDADPTEAFNAAVLAYAKENKVAYNTALNAVANDQPELYKAYRGGK